ncbi:four helix bundle protein [Thermodesulfobacteriota bacterium]
MGYLQLSRRYPRGYKGSGVRVNCKDLKVWQKSYELCLAVYRITAKFPKEERYGLTSQIRRSVVSIPFRHSKFLKTTPFQDHPGAALPSGRFWAGSFTHRA